jgi:hypothetical protein
MQLLRIIIIMLQNITTGIRLIRSLTLPSFSLSLSLSLSLYLSDSLWRFACIFLIIIIVLHRRVINEY